MLANRWPTCSRVCLAFCVLLYCMFEQGCTDVHCLLGLSLPRPLTPPGAAMSQFSTMTTRERKMQAAAICREVQAQEDTEMDLGKKMNVPKDIMLEELSLASNRGSRLFKMRQRRSEKYTFESVRNENNKQLNSMAFSQTESGNPADSHSGESDQPPKVPSDTPDTRMVPDPDSIAPGYGGPLKDVPPEKFNSTAVPKSYFSPWEQAISRDPALAGSFITCMPEPEPQPDLPGYKSFNRVATPFRGFGKAPRSATINLPQVDALPDFPELRGDAAVDRPSFNRAALGWVTVGGPVPLSAVTLEHALIPESEDL
ncbi:myozenin-2-like isoform X1 [Scophthalmus maximus]|uniref:myozenin-2-like isoform X1 n=1 Tax=Scophthalmus maximus TaxID=52904 RepID=UPI001FA876C6|nr:myozenin-2-like isoform X1 [Scophthalmus maximus]